MSNNNKQINGYRGVISLRGWRWLVVWTNSLDRKYLPCLWLDAERLDPARFIAVFLFLVLLTQTPMMRGPASILHKKNHSYFCLVLFSKRWILPCRLQNYLTYLNWIIRLVVVIVLVRELSTIEDSSNVLVLLKRQASSSVVTFCNFKFRM